LKDRVALKMIDEAERAGLIRPGHSVLVEATSGNTGIAVAMVGAARGYKVVVAMPRLQAMFSRYMLIRSFGGEVLLSDPESQSQGFLDLAEQYARENGEAFLLRQFTNPSNPAAHYETTGPELWAQMGGDVDAFFAGAGTGGTALGAGRFLKEASRGACRVVVVEPAESRVLQGAVHRVHSIVGIGTG
jgi:cysteine synthase A